MRRHVRAACWRALALGASAPPARSRSFNSSAQAISRRRAISSVPAYRTVPQPAAKFTTKLAAKPSSRVTTTPSPQPLARSASRAAASTGQPPRSPRRASRNARPQVAQIERRRGAGRSRLHERREIGLALDIRDQELRRGDRRDAEESRQRLLLPRQRQSSAKTTSTAPSPITAMRSASIRPTPTISTAAPRPTKPRRISTARSPTTTRPSRPAPIRSTPTTTAAPSFSARATSPAPPPTTAK